MTLNFRIEGINPQKVTLSGSLDEKANLAPLFDQLKGKVVFCLGEIDRVNSLGIRNWIRLIEEYSKKNEVEISRIPYPLVVQCNVILNLFGRAKISSCMAPYYCATCDKDVTFEVKSVDLKNQNEFIPNCNCPICNEHLVFNELPSYFDFLRTKASA